MFLVFPYCPPACYGLYTQAPSHTPGKLLPAHYVKEGRCLISMPRVGGATMLPTFALPKLAHLPSESVLTPDGSPAQTQALAAVKPSGSLATQGVDGTSKPPTSAGHASINNPHSNGTGSNGGPSNGFISSAHGSYSNIPGTNGMPSTGTALHSGNGSNGQSIHTSPAVNVHGNLMNGKSSAAPSGNLSETQQAVRSVDHARCRCQVSLLPDDNEFTWRPGMSRRMGSRTFFSHLLLVLQW